MGIDTELVRKLIHDQFPQWSELPIKPVARSGWDNRTFRLGESLLVRLPSAEQYAAQVPKEQKWLPFLTERLSTQIPQVQALGKPGNGFPWSWSVYGWIDGEDIDPVFNGDVCSMAKSLAQFITELHSTETTNGPRPGLHNYFRGGDLLKYDNDTREYTRLLAGEICADSALQIWSKALETNWKFDPVWVHGDLEASNMLVANDQLVAVIDFGNCAVGDPACDLVMAWTFFDTRARKIFKSALEIDDDTWDRAKAWALWKAMFRMSKSLASRDKEFYDAKRLVESIFSATR